MNIKRMAGITGVVLACGILAAVGRSLSKEKKCQVLDEEGTIIAEIIYQDQAVHYDCKEGYEAYADLAYREAAAIMKEREDV